MLWSILGHQAYNQASDFIFVVPGWPLCSSCNKACGPCGGMTTLEPTTDTLNGLKALLASDKIQSVTDLLGLTNPPLPDVAQLTDWGPAWSKA